MVDELSHLEKQEETPKLVIIQVLNKMQICVIQL